MQAVKGTQAGVVLHLVFEFFAEADILPFPGEAGEAVKPLGQLADFFPQGHPAQQVMNPLLHRKGRILIRIHFKLPRIAKSATGSAGG